MLFVFFLLRIVHFLVSVVCRQTCVRRITNKRVSNSLNKIRTLFFFARDFFSCKRHNTHQGHSTCLVKFVTADCQAFVGNLIVFACLLEMAGSVMVFLSVVYVSSRAGTIKVVTRARAPRGNSVRGKLSVQLLVGKEIVLVVFFLPDNVRSSRQGVCRVERE